MRRYIESALRIKWRLIIAALLVFAAAVVALSFAKGGYTVSALVWVEKPLYITNPDRTSDYISAATMQSNVLDQLLGTQTFKLTIAQRARIPIRTSAEQARVLTDLNTSLRVEPYGANLIRLVYTTDKAQFAEDYAQEIISQTILTFIVYQNASRVQQADSSLRIYESQLTSTQDALDKSKEALETYIQEHPGSGTGNIPDPTYTDLQLQYTNNLDAVGTLKGKIGQLTVQRDAPQEVNTNFLRVIDAPNKPEAYKSSTKDLVRNLGMAMALAMLMILALTLVGTWTDQAVYTLNDVSALALTDEEGDARELLVGVIPYVSSLGGIRKREGKQSKRGKAQQPATAAARSSSVAAKATTQQ